MNDSDFTKRFSAEKLAELGAHAPSAVDQGEVAARWDALFADIELLRDSHPASPAAQAILARWDALTAEFTMHDPELERSLLGLHPDPAHLDRGAFITHARKARRTGE